MVGDPDYLQSNFTGCDRTGVLRQGPGFLRNPVPGKL